MLKLLARSGAAVAIVGGLVFAMPIAASADVWDYALFELIASAGAGGAGGAVAGAGVTAAAPEAVAGTGFACAAALPFCAAVGGAVVGAALYATKDTWVPWIQGLFGAVTGGGGTSEGCVVYCGEWLDAPDGTTLGEGFTVTVSTIPGTNNNWDIWADYSWTVSCKLAALPRRAGQGTDLGSIRMASGQATGSGVSVGGYKGQWSGVETYRSESNGGGDSQGCHSNETIDGVSGRSTGVMNGGGMGGGTMTWGASVPITSANTTTSLQVNCQNPDGSQYAVTSEAPLGTGDVVKMPTCTGATGDLGGAHGKCVTLAAGETGGVMVVQGSSCATVAGADLMYPNCSVSGCQYQVYVDGLPCVVGRPGCSDWGRTYANSPGQVGCRYGEYAVRVSACFFLERVYEASGAPVQGTLANTDGNPDTFTGPTPLPNPGPQPQPQPIPNGAPGGAPGTLPGGGTAPLPGLAGVPVTNGDCWDDGTFSWNPIDWVVTPVKCALAWAFVPSPAALANFSNGVGTAFGTTSFGRWSASVGGLVPAISGQGCAGPSVSTGFMSGLPGHPLPAEIHPFDACSAPMSTVAHVSYLILSAGIAFYGGMKVVRQLGYAFGFQIHAGSERSTFT